MEDKKDPNSQKDNQNSNNGIKVSFKPDDKEPVFVVKKTPEEIKRDNIALAKQKDPLDINANLGSFMNVDEPDKLKDKVEREVKVISASSVSTFEKIAEVKQITPDVNNDNVKIDFEKFDRKKQSKVKTKLGVQLDIWLRQKNSLIKIWVLAIASILITCGAQIAYLVLVTGLLKAPKTGNLYHDVAIAGNVLSYIAVSLPILPIIYLITAAIIGINGVLSSRTFHYFLWSIIIVCFVLFITSTCLSGTYMYENYTFTYFIG